ncbi:MAG: ATP-binding protein [Bdellovibrio sp.]
MKNKSNVNVKERTWIIEKLAAGDLQSIHDFKSAVPALLGQDIHLWQACLEMERKIDLLRRIARNEVVVMPDFERNDQIGAAIREIYQYINNFDKTTRETKLALEEERNKLIQEDWIKSQSSNLFSKIQGVRTLKELGDILLAEISASLDAHLAAFFIKEENSNPDKPPKIVLMSSYGFDPDSVKNSFHLGEGLVGQCARDLKIRHLETVPQDYTRFNTGFGAILPASVLLIPIVYENVLYGVFEFASLKKFGDLETRFLKEVASAIGVSIKSITGYMFTERLLTEIARKNNSLASQKQALDCSAIVAETDLRGRITYVNDKFLEISKYSREDLMGQDHRILNSTYHPKEFFVNLWKTISKGNVWHGEVRNRAKDGSFYWVDTTIYPVKDEKGKLQKFVAIRFDVTDKKQVMEALQLATESARRAATVKTEFLANMSHEIRTPMNAIVGMTDILKETMLNTDQQRIVNTLSNACEALLDIINSILDLSKLESGHLEFENINFDLEELIETACGIMSRSAQKKGLEFTYHIPPSIPTMLTGDPSRIRQVLINLIGNAVKFTKTGEINVNVRMVSENPLNIEFSVKDSGIGIPEDKSYKLFQNFSQVSNSTSREYGGTGLGLAISKRIVEGLGGNISFESKEGIGSRFFFQLPLKSSHQIDTKNEGLESLLWPKKVYLLERSNSARQTIQDYISYYHVNIQTVSSLDALKDLIQEQGPADAILAGITGEEEEKEILQIVKESPIKKVIFLANADEQISLRQRSVWDKEITYLGKPCRRIDLVRSIAVQTMKNQDCPPIKIESRSSFLDMISQTQKLRVLVVDDVNTNLDIVKIYLKDEPIDLDLAHNGLEAVSKFEENKYDLILMDIQMPILDGRAATKRIRATEQEKGLNRTKIVALSAHATSDEINESMAIGCDGHLVKPLKKKALLEAIRNHLTKAAAA